MGKKIKIRVNGMTCNGCVENISKMIMNLGTVKSIKINLDEKIGIINTNSKFDKDDFLNTFVESKFNVEILNEQVNHKITLLSKLKNFILQKN
ncbi:MAG: hypothetical protein CMF96_06405 [Candidatus Marinimicrobia bacterium]|nr:hypothetical protein [Candidatus Neomarinimicrobiota bacterium]|tara:strand:+ start:650 stop:928 length:279 start_codon:yes stop_codon:yes gene_type:complete